MICVSRWAAIASLTILAALARGGSSTAEAADEIDYNRDVRQILSDHCYACHGPDQAKRQAGLRLDREDSAKSELESGSRAIVPGDTSASELIARITATDDSVMPPAEGGKPLKPEHVARLKSWVEQGAKWKGHWSYLPIEPAALPAVSDSAWPRTPIDYFILERLDRDGVKPSPPADKATLARRLSFDLTGLPPSPADVESFVADHSSDAYERLVDRLLASPRYGERMAQRWLDLARYADTNGYHIDNHRDMWRYREWVIGAFNRNLPFDQFTTEQIAGDLLPAATLDQKIASGFHRNVMVNFEGGADPAEYLTKYVVDRVTTTATVFLGSTLACAECHDHKYDPFTQRDFYQLYAYFNNVPEQGLDGQKENPKPSMKVPSPEQLERMQALRSQTTELEERVRGELAKTRLDAPRPSPPSEPYEYTWVDDELPAGSSPDGDAKKKGWSWAASPEPVLQGRRASVGTASERSQHLFTGPKYPLVIGAGDKLVAHVFIDPANTPAEIMLQFNDGSGWEHRAYWGENKIDWGSEGGPSRLAMGALPAAGQWVRLEVDAAAINLQPGSIVDGWSCTQFGGHVYWDRLGMVTSTPQGPENAVDQGAWEVVERARKSSLPQEVRDALTVSTDTRTPHQQETVRNHFVRHFYAPARAVFNALNAEAERLAKAQSDLEASYSSTMVMEEMPKRRDTFILVRGDFRTFGETVTPGVPARLPPLREGSPPNRLGLAQWLVDPRNPLVSRVTVNRYWQQYFGTGLVKTSEDFGSQGEWPTHPELLDWLASQFIASGWDVKAIQKMIVMSATYRQSSRTTPESIKYDPYNRMLSRGARFRLDAEMIRDCALAVSGLIDNRIGGPSVSPYQPDGLWEEVGFGGGFSAQSYTQSHGADLYRRGIYTYWKRALPYPPLITFDAPNREVCTDCRARTNTPLQALVLLNDPGFVETARALGQRVIRQGGATLEERMRFAFVLCTSRPPRPQELEVLVRLFGAELKRFQQNPAAAAKLTSVGELPRPADLDAAELAAWTAIGNVLLNLDETITKG
jgi:mono/diheme cytochrome c family protein